MYGLFDYAREERHIPLGRASTWRSCHPRAGPNHPHRDESGRRNTTGHTDSGRRLASTGFGLQGGHVGIRSRALEAHWIQWPVKGLPRFVRPYDDAMVVVVVPQTSTVVGRDEAGAERPEGVKRRAPSGVSSDEDGEPLVCSAQSAGEDVAGVVGAEVRSRAVRTTTRERCDRETRDSRCDRMRMRVANDASASDCEGERPRELLGESSDAGVCMTLPEPITRASVATSGCRYSGPRLDYRRTVSRIIVESPGDRNDRLPTVD